MMLDIILPIVKLPTATYFNADISIQNETPTANCNTANCPLLLTNPPPSLMLLLLLQFLPQDCVVRLL